MVQVRCCIYSFVLETYKCTVVWFLLYRRCCWPGLVLTMYERKADIESQRDTIAEELITRRKALASFPSSGSWQRATLNLWDKLAPFGNCTKLYAKHLFYAIGLLATGVSITENKQLDAQQQKSSAVDEEEEENQRLLQRYLDELKACCDGGALLPRQVAVAYAQIAFAHFPASDRLLTPRHAFCGGQVEMVGRAFSFPFSPVNVCDMRNLLVAWDAACPELSRAVPYVDAEDFSFYALLEQRAKHLENDEARQRSQQPKPQEKQDESINAMNASILHVLAQASAFPIEVRLRCARVACLLRENQLTEQSNPTPGANHQPTQMWIASRCLLLRLLAEWNRRTPQHLENEVATIETFPQAGNYIARRHLHIVKAYLQGVQACSKQ